MISRRAPSDTFTIYETQVPLQGAFSNVASGGRLNTVGGDGSFVVTYTGANAVTLSNFGPTVCVTPPPDMISWWPGDGNANDIQDGNNGTLQGATTFVPGEVLQAFSFDGTDDYVLVPHNANQNTGAQITLDAWVLLPNPFPPSVVTAPEIISKHTLNMSDGYRFEIINSPPRSVFNALYIEITTTDGFFDIEVPDAITLGLGNMLPRLMMDRRSDFTSTA